MSKKVQFLSCGVYESEMQTVKLDYSGQETKMMKRSFFLWL